MEICGLIGSTRPNEYVDKKKGNLLVANGMLADVHDDTAGSVTVQFGVGFKQDQLPPRGADVRLIVERVSAPAANMLRFQVKSWALRDGAAKQAGAVPAVPSFETAAPGQPEGRGGRR